VIEIREVLRLWLSGLGLQTVAVRAGVDRKTARRYIDAAVVAGSDRDGGVDQRTDDLIGAVVTAVRPDRPRGTELPGKRCAPTMIGAIEVRIASANRCRILPRCACWQLRQRRLPSSTD